MSLPLCGNDPPLLREAARLVMGSVTPRQRMLTCVTLVLALEAFQVPELGAPVAAVLAVFDARQGADKVLFGAVNVAANAVLHRGLRAGKIIHEVGQDRIEWTPDGVPFVCAWLTFRAVAELIADLEPSGLHKAWALLADALRMLGSYPAETEKLIAFFRAVDLTEKTSEEPPPLGGTA